jgi:flagellar export protein FliJ
MHQQQALLSQWENEVRRIQQVAVQAAARRKALEKLRERRAQEYHDHEQHRAEQELDELVTLRYARARSTEWDANDTYRG